MRRVFIRKRAVFLFSAGTLQIENVTKRFCNEAEERLRLAPEAARVGVWTYDLATHRIICSSELRANLWRYAGVLHR